MKRTLAAALAVVLTASQLPAAEGKGVVRYNELPVPGAAVSAVQGDKKFATITNENGAYYFADLPDGVWNERVEMLGFAPAQQDVNVGPGAPGPVWDLKIVTFDELKALAPAAPVEEPAPAVSVNTPPPADNKAEATKSKGNKAAAAAGGNTKQTFQRTEVAAVAPPAAPAESAAPSADASDSFAINGSANNGAASAYSTSPAFGNARKGPGSLYNGTLFANLGNSALDARPFSITGLDTPKAAYNHLTAGITVGGPVRIPHWFQGNNPVTFFVAYQVARNRNADTVPFVVPTLDQRNGDGLAASQIAPQAQALLRFYPLPNLSSGRYNYQTAIRSTADSDNLQTRLNKNFRRLGQLSGNFAWQRASTDADNVFHFNDATHTSGIDLNLTLTHRFNQRFFGTVRYQFNRLSTEGTPYFANRENVSGEAGIGGNLQDPLDWGPPALNFSSGIVGLYDGQQYLNRSQTQAVGVNAYFNHSPHNFTFGGDFKRQQFNNLGQQDARGSFTFTDAGVTGADFQHFLLGLPDTSNIAFGNADKYFRANIYDAYLTDDWRVSPSLTLNLGGRWEYNSPITEKYGRLVNLAVAPDFSSVNPLVANATAQALLNPYRSGFQPRLGIAWRPISGSSLVLRAGYGITQDTSVYFPIAARMSQQAPLSKSLSVSAMQTPITLANGFSSSGNTTPTTFAVDPNFRPGYAQTWQLQIQRDLPASLVVIATYLGIKGTRAQQLFLPNTFPAGSKNPSGYSYLTSNGNSTRESGQLQLRRRLRAGFTATLQYTYSKSIDDAALGGRGQGTQVIAQNWLDLSAERGLSPFDQRHLLNFQTQYTYKQWTATAQVTAGSGFPLTPIVIQATPGTGVTGTFRPDYLGSDVYAAAPGFHLNKAAFVAANGHWGTAGRNSIEGPGQFSVDSSVGRNFRIRDRFDTEMRLSATNALNHVVYAAWSTVLNDQFGLPTGARPMRTIQLTLRAKF